ncbi:hypothetical protein LshimejAT787_0104940 [Lyophyllum shimeji]|uniref:Uncharacterized protein n=1 Tax=Lyophyllum shimeji TaxID=47721 RepID=A0A9P3UJQ3_LYOSH|nr:hypothetical protein LshimejAT787_0104940 [Lyophyllum shimeji]
MHPELDEKTFTVAFEEDLFRLVQDQGVYRTRSIFKTRDAVKDVHSEGVAVDDPEYLVTEAEIADSYLSATLSTIQPVGDRKSLLTLDIACHPAPGRRFVNATIIWQISSPPPSTSPTKSPVVASSPKVITLAPQHSVGGWTEEQTKLIWGLNVAVGPGIPGASVNVEPSVGKETQKAVMHAMTILGTVRSGGTRAHWTVEENKSSRRGIPSHFQLAIVVEHSGLFASSLDVKAELGGGLWPTFIQAKKGRNGDPLRRVIDVEHWKCGEVRWEPGEQGWKKYVAGLTGEIPDVVVEFSQAVVRP